MWLSQLDKAENLERCQKTAPGDPGKKDKRCQCKNLWWSLMCQDYQITWEPFFFSKHRISGFQTPKQHLLHHKLVHPNDWVSWHNPSNIVYVRLRLSAKRILVNYTLWKPNNVVRSGFHSLVIPAGHCPFIQWWGCVHPGQGGTLMWTGSQGGYLWEKEMTICELRRGP